MKYFESDLMAVFNQQKLTILASMKKIFCILLIRVTKTYSTESLLRYFFASWHLRMEDFDSDLLAFSNQRMLTILASMTIFFCLLLIRVTQTHSTDSKFA